MSREKISYEEQLAAGRSIFIDHEEYNDLVIVASYRLITNVFPQIHWTSNSVSIFNLQASQLNLPRHYQEVINYMYYMGLSSEQTGSRMSKTATQVELIEYKAVWALRRFAKTFIIK